MKEGNQQEIHQLMGDIFRKKKKQSHLTLNIIRHNWSAIVGEDLSSKTYPARIFRNVLWINALDGSWAYQLQFMKSEILQSVKAFIASDSIGELRFRMGEVPQAEEAPPEASTNEQDSNQPEDAGQEYDQPINEGFVSDGPDPAVEAIPDINLRNSFSSWRIGQLKKKMERPEK